MKRYDAVIIGSGISSLTAAILLAQEGRSVCVLEQHYLPGGYLHSFRKLGHSFDTGAHYVGAMDPGQPFRTLLQYLGVYRDDIFTALDASGFDELHFPDFTTSFAKGYHQTIENFSKIFPNERKVIQEYFQLIHQGALTFPTYNFHTETDGPRLAELMEVSLDTVAKRLTQNKGLLSLFYSYCVLHGVYPQDLPFGFHAIITDSLIRGPYGFKTNGNALADAYVDRLKSLGGELKLRTLVSKLTVTNDHINTVITDKGEEFSADWVISGVHPKNLMALLEPNTLSKAFKTRVENTSESIGIFGLYAVCNSKLNLHPLKNYYFFNSADPEGWSSPRNPNEIPHATFLARSNRESKDMPEFSINLHSASPYSWFSQWQNTNPKTRPTEYKELKSLYSQQILDLVESHRIPIRSCIRDFTTSSPLTNQHFNPSPEGAAYGIYHSMDVTGPRALGPRTKIRNLLLTGQNTLFPGLFAAATSGLRTAANVIGMKPTISKLQSGLGDMVNFR